MSRKKNTILFITFAFVIQLFSGCTANSTDKDHIDEAQTSKPLPNSVSSIAPKATSVETKTTETSGMENDKVYTCHEVIELLDKAPDQLRNKQIKLKAYAVDATQGLDCYNFFILIDKADDKKYTAEGMKRYSEKPEDKEYIAKNGVREIKTAPSVESQGSAMAEKGIGRPEQPRLYTQGIYLGHFFDSHIQKMCKDTSKSFYIEKVVKQIAPGEPLQLEKTISTGAVIVNDIGIQPPLHIVLKNNQISVNEIVYCSCTAQNERTNEFMKSEFDSLVKSLEFNDAIIFYEDRFETRRNNVPKDFIVTIDAIVKSKKSDDQKRASISKLLNLSDEHHSSIIDSLLKNWKMAEPK